MDNWVWFLRSKFFAFLNDLKILSSLNPTDIKVIVDFNDWSHLKQFYEPKVSIPKNLLDWRDISPKNVEIGVAREIKWLF